MSLGTESELEVIQGQIQLALSDLFSKSSRLVVATTEMTKEFLLSLLRPVSSSDWVVVKLPSSHFRESAPILKAAVFEGVLVACVLSQFDVLEQVAIANSLVGRFLDVCVLESVDGDDGNFFIATNKKEASKWELGEIARMSLEHPDRRAVVAVCVLERDFSGSCFTQGGLDSLLEFMKTHQSFSPISGSLESFNKKSFIAKMKARQCPGLYT